METGAAPHFIALDRMREGLCIHFSDGSKGFYTYALLYSILDQAKELPKDCPDDEE
jgi:hypothetical protein